MWQPPLSNICCSCVLLLALGLTEWLFHATISAITTLCVCLRVSVCWKCVFVVLWWRGGAGWTNMSFWVSGCRANIDQHARRHPAGQIKHSSDSRRAQRANDMPYHLDELASVCQTDHQHTTQWEGGRHRDELKLLTYVLQLCWLVYFDL